MATLALYAVGAAAFPSLLGIGASSAIIGGLTAASLGGLIGGTIGGFIDQTFIFPAIFGNPKGASGPRLEDLTTQLVNEGSPVMFCVGPENRIAGTIIWMTDLVENKKTKRSGGGTGGGQKTTTYTYTVSVAIAWCEGAIMDVSKIWANGKVIYDGVTEDSRYDSITHYKGTGTQNADPLIQSIEGAENVPAFRGTAYTVIENLLLTDFGNRMPVFTAFIKQNSDNTLAACLKTIFSRAGWNPSYYDLSLLSEDDVVRGYAMAGPQSVIKCIEPLILAYALGVRDNGGVLQFFPRGNTDEATVQTYDMAAHEFDSEVPRVLTLTDNKGQTLPSEVNVIHIDPTNNYQQGNQRDARMVFANRVVTTVNLPMTLSPGQAKAIAARQLWTAHAERILAEFALTPRWMNLQEGDIVNVTLGAEQYAIIVTDMSTGWNFINKIKGIVIQSQTVRDITGVSDTGGGDDGGTIVTPVSSLTTHYLNLPPLQDAQVNTAGFYIATCVTNPDKKFRGATLYASTDGTTYEDVETFNKEAKIGVTNTALASGVVGDLGVKDTVNTVEVVLKEGELTSATLSEIAKGKNIAVIGSEIVAFETVELIGIRTYRLSNLYRGLRDTRDTAELEGHIIGEKFILLEQDTLIFIPLEIGQINVPISLKMVPTYGLVANYPAIQFTPNGETLRCFRPDPIWRNTAITPPPNIGIAWMRRSRYVSSVINGTINPLEEAVEAYDILIYEWTGSEPGALLRSVLNFQPASSTDYEPYFIYTDAMQTEDSRASNGASVYVEVYQLGAVLGRGNKGSAVV